MPFQQSVWAIIVFLYYKTRSSLIHFASIVAAPPRLFTPQANACGENSQGGATSMQAKRIKLDLCLYIEQCGVKFKCVTMASMNFMSRSPKGHLLKIGRAHV